MVEDFRSLLNSLDNLSYESDWNKVKLQIKNEEAYKELKSKTLKQNIFEEIIMSKLKPG